MSAVLADVLPLLPRHELSAVETGAWFGELSGGLQRAILARARLRHVRAGALLARRGDAAADWIGVTRGAVLLGTALRDGRPFTLDLIGPGQWYGDVALLDRKPQDLDLQAHVDSSVLLLARADVHTLTAQHAELRDAFIQLNCQRLRSLFRRFEELHTLPLGERLARQLQRLGRHFGRATPGGWQIDLRLSQSDLAAMVGGSRQRVNLAWRQMHKLGIVSAGDARIAVFDQDMLDAVAQGRIQLAGTPH
jgi:CRP-like cAMP-binding protein